MLGGGFVNNVGDWLLAAVIATNVLQALCLLPLLAVCADRLWPAFVVAVFQGGLRAVNVPASFAMVPRIVPGDHLTEANAANSVAGSFARLIGSPLGGIAAAVGGLNAVVTSDGASFLVVAGAIWLVRTSTPSLATEAGPEGKASGV